jgi:large subunit ribosomal protein L32
LKQGTLSKCQDCGQPKLNHKICSNCGKYKGRVVVDVLAKTAKREKKAKEKAKENK